MNQTDQTLVHLSQRKDRTAFEELVRRTARLVYSRIYLDVGDTHRAEDLVQETFMIAGRSIAQVTDPGGFRSWLLSIAKTVTVDSQRHLTRKKRNQPIDRSADSSSLVLDSRPGPGETAEREEERQRMLGVLQCLPEEYRLPLMLRYLGGADYDTIGRQLGLTNGSLRGLLNRGMAKLREEMKAKEV